MTEPRTLKLISPHVSGNDVKELQKLLNQRYAGWEIDERVNVDGDYGMATRTAAGEVCFGLGIDALLYEHGLTPQARTLIRHPDQRTQAQLARATGRTAWRHRLRMRHMEGDGAKLAISYARQHLGVHEQPPGSNRGPVIDRWNRMVGTPPGPYAYWCGAFANACLVAAGLKPQRFMAYCPSIVSMAQGKRDGWEWVSLSKGKVGDLPIYREGRVAGHVGVLEVVEGFVTIEGNTSGEGKSGSQSNGGMVAERHRNPRSKGFPVMGLARPPYQLVRS